MSILSVGCGRKPQQLDLVRLDISPEVDPDIVWDLENIPYPFKDSTFSEIECFDVIEHLSNIPNNLEEFHRILKPGGLLKITTPHFSCANSYIDPTHKWHLSYCSFDYFSDDHTLSYYSKARYQTKYRHIQFQGGRINRSIISRLANKYPINYEQRWAWIFPAWYIYFELEAIK
ncbi:class I SAM-dependent methyltransferase [Nostoc sp.]|uniref:class I SAM-dependent methyltransferase n=1 Tax=Nostoc sp. TaxID=1180 RepID=UPI002FFBB96B